jgi:hypothetical protein
MQYRDDMTPEEIAALLVEVEALDRAYAEAEAAAVPARRRKPRPWRSRV